MAITPRTHHTRRSDRPGGRAAARGGHDRAAACCRSGPRCRRLSPPRRAPPSPSPRGVRRGPPPALAARHGDGGRTGLWPGRGAESPIGRNVVADPPSLDIADRSDDARPDATVPASTSTAPSTPRPPSTTASRSPRRSARSWTSPTSSPRNTHPSPQRGPGPTTHHPRRADHPPHPIPGPPHSPAHARAGRHQIRPRRRLHPLPQRHHLPLPERNQTIAGHEVDAVYREHHLVIELDSRQFHTTPRAFEHDRDRDADLLNAGFPTIRITHHRLKHHATQEARASKPSSTAKAAPSPPAAPPAYVPRGP